MCLRYPKISAAMKENWKDQSYRDKIAKARSEAPKRKYKRRVDITINRSEEGSNDLEHEPRSKMTDAVLALRKLSPDQVREIRLLIAEKKLSFYEISVLYEVSYPTISNIHTRKTYRTVL